MIKIDLDKLVIHDIETFKGLFVACFIDYKTKKRKEFIFFDSPEYAEQPFEMFKFMRSCDRSGYSFLGFNNLNFDSQVLDYFYSWCSQKQDPLYEFPAEYIILHLYTKAQELINVQDSFEKYKILKSENKLFVPQIDVFKQQHYDRPQKATSLKWLQFTMRLPDIEEMPVEHDAIIEKEDIEKIVKYCWHDVDSTLEFFERIKFETELRLELGKEYNLHLVNASEPRMVREIFGKFLCKQMDITYGELKQMRTLRSSVAFKDIIFPYTQFQTPQFKEVLDVFMAKTVNTTIGYKPEDKKNDESKFSHNFKFGGLSVDLGLGGIHACAGAGIYVPNEDEICEDADGTSFYPFLAIVNGLRPAHLGEAFNVVYPMMFAERKKYDKKDPRNYVFKIILNSAYGLSKEVNSYLYDPQFTYSITLNGQLSLLMLAEALHISIPDIKFIQMNTDGLTYIYNKKYTEKVRKICAWWEKTTKINLEYAYYKKMVIQDVNNYMAISTDGKVKKKGAFETEMFLHKNPSYLIVPKALEKYFVENKPITDFVKGNQNIYDFCAGVKKKSNFKLNLCRDFNGTELREAQQRVTRFFVSKQTENSGILVKDFNDGRRVSVLANKQVIPCNRLNPEKLDANLYPLDFEWYVQECNKIIHKIVPPVVQSELFKN